MNKKYLLSTILILALAGCNFPATSTPDLTPDLLETQVALQLTQQPIVTNTPPQPSALPVSSATASQATAAVSATATLTPAPSNTPQATATAPSTDPKASLGTPDWSDSFLNGKNWGLDAAPYEDGNTRIEIKNNALVLTSAAAIGWHGWRLSFLKPQDFYLEATIQTGACSASDLYGVIFRAPDHENGYWFGVTCDGRFNLRSGGINDFTDIAKYSANSAILSGANQTNRLGAWVKGSKISLYANGKLLGDFTDTTYPDAGLFGLFIAGFKTLNFSVQCTQIAYWNLP